jgi:hypothetical protein
MPSSAEDKIHPSPARRAGHHKRRAERAREMPPGICRLYNSSLGKETTLLMTRSRRRDSTLPIVPTRELKERSDSPRSKDLEN